MINGMLRVIISIMFILSKTFAGIEIVKYHGDPPRKRPTLLGRINPTWFRYQRADTANTCTMRQPVAQYTKFY